MIPDRYAGIVNEYESLVTYACNISTRLAGQEISEPHIPYADAIFTKLVSHAISLRKLSPSSIPNQEPELWDVASACAVARALIEAFDALSYVALNPVDSSHREFRIIIWKLHDAHRRLKMLNQIGSTNPQIPEIKQKVTELVAALHAHAFVAIKLKTDSLNENTQAMHFSQRELNTESGINNEYYIAATMYLSQYVHTYPFSVHALMGFRAGEPEALHACSMPLQYSMPFLAKAIKGMLKIFPSGFIEPNDELQNTIDFWCGIAENGI